MHVNARCGINLLLDSSLSVILKESNKIAETPQSETHKDREDEYARENMWRLFVSCSENNDIIRNQPQRCVSQSLMRCCTSLTTGYVCPPLDVCVQLAHA